MEIYYYSLGSNFIVLQFKINLMGENFVEFSFIIINLMEALIIKNFHEHYI